MAYNVIIGRETMGVVHMRTDVKFLALKFEMEDSDASMLVEILGTLA